MIPTESTSPSWWQRVKTFEPAMLRAVLAALVTVAGTVGLDLSGVAERVDTAWVAIFAIIPLLAGWWTRRAVVPKETVVEQVMPNAEVIAGPANDREMTGTVVRQLGDPVGDEDYSLDEPIS